MTSLIKRFSEATKLHGDEHRHEKTDNWSNRDLVPLPPVRRTWGLMEFFGYWAIGSFGVITWQAPAAFLTTGLSVGQTMTVIVVSRLVVSLWAFVIGMPGSTWHIGFTIQNRFSWGMRGSYVPLLQRVLLNFIWCSVQCWNGGKLAAVCITAIWPQFAMMANTFPDSVPMTTYEFVGFVVFWVVSLPLLWISPEKFRRPFQFITIYCFICSISLLIWSLATAKGVGSIFHAKQNTSSSIWSIGWLMMSALTSAIGGMAAGMTNGSDFSRYGKSITSYFTGTVLCLFVTGTLCSFIGLVTTAACQVIYGELLWNPPNLLMRIMDSGQGSSGSRAAVFFLAFGFCSTSMFENVVGNAVAGGVDLSGTFPRYINIRRGAIITFIAVWICQPWQLVNRAATFISVLSSFSVFLAPLMGIMVVDYHLLRKRKIILSGLYTIDGPYYFWKGLNLRAPPAWIVGWAPTIGGLILTAGKKPNGPEALYELYYLTFFYGFFSAALVFYLLNVIFPPTESKPRSYDEVDVYGTFTLKEASDLKITPLDTPVNESGSDIGSEKEKDAIANVSIRSL